MKNGCVFLIGLLILAVMITGCTSQTVPSAPPTQPATPVQQPVTQQTSPPAPQLVGTNWKLGWYDNTNGMWTSVVSGSSINAIFASDEKMSGFGGCNPYITVYHLMDAPKVSITRPAVSDNQCQEPIGVSSQESYYYTDLERVDTYSITDGQLIFFDKQGRKILQFDAL